MPRRSALGCYTRFVLLWMLAPTFFRLLAFTGMMSRLDTLYRVLYVGGWTMAAGIPQDLFVALQFALLTAVLNGALSWMQPSHRAWLVAVVTTILFAAVQVYLLFDYVLYLKTGLRMDTALLDFLPAAKSFVSSAEGFSMGTACLGALLVGGSLFSAYRILRHNVGEMRLSLGAMAVVPLVGCFAIPSREAVPAQLGYSLNNLVLNDEHAWVTNILDPGLRLNEDDESEALRLLTPRAERFERVSPEYPLLKRTLGFTGEKAFDVRIGDGERPHVVFLFMESFRARDIGVLGGRHDVSPNFDRLSKEGVLFSNCYSNGVQTTRGMLAALYGIVPRFSVKSVQGANYDMPLIGVADLFHRRDYTTSYFYGGDLAFENQHLFFRNHNYQEVHGEQEMAQAMPRAERTSWGYHDEFFFCYVADWIERQDRAGRPTFTTAFTISHHHPFATPSTFTRRQFDKVDPQSQHHDFLNTFAYADHALGQFVEMLRQRGLDRRTVLFIFGDHAFPMGEHAGNTLPLHNLYDENVHIPLLILAPGRVAEPKVIRDVASQVDFLPTVMDMFGMTGLNHAVGTTLMRQVPERTAYFNSPFVLQYLGLRRGDHKYFYTVKARAPAVFDLASDPDERTNLAEGLAAEVERYQRDVSLVTKFFLKLYVPQRLVSPELLDQARKPERTSQRAPRED